MTTSVVEPWSMRLGWSLRENRAEFCPHAIILPQHFAGQVKLWSVVRRSRQSGIPEAGDLPRIENATS